MLTGSFAEIVRKKQRRKIYNNVVQAAALTLLPVYAAAHAWTVWYASCASWVCVRACELNDKIDSALFDKHAVCMYATHDSKM